jgi:hypothetical protein
MHIASVFSRRALSVGRHAAIRHRQAVASGRVRCEAVGVQVSHAPLSRPGATVRCAAGVPYRHRPRSACAAVRDTQGRRQPGPATSATGFGGLFALSFFCWGALPKPALPKPVAGVAAPSVCWRCDASVPPAGVFAGPAPAAWGGTEITYASTFSCVGMVLAIGERTRDAMRHKKAKLEFVGNAPYGFQLAADKRYVELEPGEHRAATIPAIARRARRVDRR